jgi:hypothetical protein
MSSQSLPYKRATSRQTRKTVIKRFIEWLCADSIEDKLKEDDTREQFHEEAPMFSAYGMSGKLDNEYAPESGARVQVSSQHIVEQARESQRLPPDVGFR